MTKCSCDKHEMREGQRYCVACHAKYMRKWRKSHPLTELQKKKDTARSYLHVYLKRGKVKKEPCEVCGANKVEAHHEDYKKPLKVRWLCRIHHLEAESNVARETSHTQHIGA